MCDNICEETNRKITLNRIYNTLGKTDILRDYEIGKFLDTSFLINGKFEDEDGNIQLIKEKLLPNIKMAQNFFKLMLMIYDSQPEK